MSANGDDRREPALRTVGLTVRYGGVTANDSIDLYVDSGEVVGLIGPNGAGKTTFIDAATGFTPYSGEIWVGGQCVDGLPPHRRREAAIARTWQAGELFTDLSAEENLLVACRSVTARTLLGDLVGRGRSRRDPDAERALAAVGLPGAGDRRPGSFSLGEQKLVGVARALAGDTRALLLDEPAAGLDVEESRRFGEQLRVIAQRDIGVLLVDHDLKLVLEVCDRIYVLDFGGVICTGCPDAIVASPEVVAAYIGSPEPETREVPS